MYVHWGCSTLDDMSDSCALYNEVLILWFQAGQKLENGKTLAPCPRCSLPSQIDGVSNVGQCTHKTCQYLFCCICHCESHNGSSCPYLMPFPQFKKRSSSMCSKQSKKNLRRLWLILCNGCAQNHMLPIAVLLLHHTTTDTFALHKWWRDHKLYLHAQSRVRCISISFMFAVFISGWTNNLNVEFACHFNYCIVWHFH